MTFARYRHLAGHLSGSIRRLSSGAAARTFGTQVFVTLLNLISGVLTARLLGPDGRGLFAAATLWPQILLAVFCGGLPAAIVFHVRNEPGERSSIFSAILVLGTLASLVAAAIGFAIVPRVMPNYSQTDLLICQLCVLAVLPSMLLLVLRQMAVALQMFPTFNTALYLPALLYVLLMLLVLIMSPLTVPAALICLYASITAATLWSFARLCRACSLSSAKLGMWIKRLVSYSLRGAPADIFSGIAGHLDRLVLVAIVTPEVLGLYAVALSLSRLILILQVILNSLVFARMAGQPEAEVLRIHGDVFRLTAYAATGAVVGILVLGQPAITIFYGSQFTSAHLVFVILSVEAGLICIGQVTLLTFYALDRPGYASVAQGASLVTAVVAMLLLAPVYGAEGAAAAMAVAALVRIVVLLWRLARSYKSGLPRLHPTASDLHRFRALLRG